MIRSDAGEAHRLSLSARVLSAQDSQVKAKTIAAEALLTHFEMTPKQLTKHPEIAALTERTRTLPPAHRPHSTRVGAAPDYTQRVPFGPIWGAVARLAIESPNQRQDLLLPGYYFLHAFARPGGSQ